MEDKKILLDNIDKIHTTEMGIDRIKRNLKIDTADVVEYCKNKVLDKNCNICTMYDWRGHRSHFADFTVFQFCN